MHDTRLFYWSPPNTTYMLDRHILSWDFVVSSIPLAFPARMHLSVRWLFGAYSIALGPSSPCQLRALRTSVTHLSLRRFLSVILNLIALSSSQTSPSPTQTPLVAPMLLMAGLVMHRHVLIALFRSTCPLWQTQYCASLIVFRHIPTTR